MSYLMRSLLLQLFVISVFGQVAGKGQTGHSTSRPAAVVQSLYRQVIARQPLGIPTGANWKVFAPYLSKELRHAIELARSCADDWSRQNQSRTMGKNQLPAKAPIAWSELGLFSGAEELSEPSSFKIQRTESNQDGSFRVYVKLTEAPPNDKPWSWDIAVKVKTEAKRPVIDDIIYLKGNDVRTEYRLSEILTEGCNGAHWVGGNKQLVHPK
jgi:hypothetical protein